MSSDVTEALHALGFRASRESIMALLHHATKSRLGPIETVEQLVALENHERERRNLDRRTSEATLGTVPALDRFDWSHPRKIEHSLYQELLTLHFLNNSHNVLFRGPSGIGKTMLAQNLGLEALKHGLTVRFSTVAAALTDVLKQESLPAIERRLRRYVQPSLLILDELGYVPVDTRAADVLYNIISRRHEQRSTIISTNLPFKQWGAVFPGAACVAALVDRFAQNCHVMDIDADSWRQKHSTPPPPSPAPNGGSAGKGKRAARQRT